jgi:hypothetical protein
MLAPASTSGSLDGNYIYADPLPLEEARKLASVLFDVFNS